MKRRGWQMRRCILCSNRSKTWNAPMRISLPYANHADVVGAINILRAGQARSACEVNPN